MSETQPAAEQPESPVDHDGPLWDVEPVDDAPEDGADPTGAPPEDWYQGAHSKMYDADPAVDTSPVGDAGVC